VKFLIDNALPPQVADLLAEAGYDAVHVRNYQMQAARDEDIMARARDEDRIVVSADSDFATILSTRGHDRPSFILFREPNLLVARDYIRVLVPALSALQPDLDAGCVAVFRHKRLRIRKLPISE